MSEVRGLTGIDAVVAESKDRLAAKDADLARLRTSHAALREALEEIGRFELVIESAVRNADPGNRAAVMAAIDKCRAALANQ